MPLRTASYVRHSNNARRPSEIAVRRQNEAIQERDTAAQKCDAAEEDALKQRASYSRLEDSLKHFQATFNKNDPRFDTDLIKKEEEV